MDRFMKTHIRTHEGRVALVTGAGQGIGQAIALALAQRGAQVIATDLKLPEETANKIGPKAYAFQLDVTREENWQSVAVNSRDVGEVDIVVNNAGYFPNRSIDDLDLPTWSVRNLVLSFRFPDRKLRSRTFVAQFLCESSFCVFHPSKVTSAPSVRGVYQKRGVR